MDLKRVAENIVAKWAETEVQFLNWGIRDNVEIEFVSNKERADIYYNGKAWASIFLSDEYDFVVYTLNPIKLEGSCNGRDVFANYICLLGYLIDACYAIGKSTKVYTDYSCD